VKPVNLLPENLRPRAHREGSGGAFVVLGVLGALLVAVLLYVVTANQVTSREAETQKLRTETLAAEQRGGALARFGAFQQMKEIRVASVSTLAAGRFDWERMARELALVLPTGVWLTELKATATGEEAQSGGGSSSGSSSSSSGSSSSSTGATPGEQGPGLTILGCAPTQEAVAETMVRLRRLHQAQEVSLTSSERDKQGSPTASAAPAPSAGAGATPPPPSGTAGGASGAGAVQGCGTKRGRSNYKFEVKVTLVPTPDPTVGGRSVPRSLGGGA